MKYGIIQSWKSWLLTSALAVVIFSCNSDKNEFALLEPVWKAASDSVFKAQGYITSKRNFNAAKLNTMAENERFEDYMDSATVWYLDSIQLLAQQEMLFIEVLKGNFQSIVKATEQHDLKMNIVRNSINKGNSKIDVAKFVDSTYNLCDSLIRASTKYKLTATQSYAMTANLFQAYNERYNQELPTINTKLQQGETK